MARFSVAFALVLAAPFVPSTVCAGNLFALVDTGEIFASTDGGVSWEPLSVLPVSDAIGLIAGATSSDLTLATRAGVVYRSTDSGVNWSATGALPSSDVVDVQIRPDGALLVLTATGTIWVSTDAGSTFTALAALTGSDYVSLAVGEAGYLYALTKSGHVEESVDEGVSWSLKGVITVPDAVEIRGLLGTELYVLTGAGLIFRSEDAGSSWTTVGTLSQVHMSGLTQDVNRLAAITQEGEVANSVDGASWTWMGTVNQVSVTALANDIPYAVGIPEESIPARLRLAPPRPNPLWPGNRIVTLLFTLSKADYVRTSLYDLQGREVLTRAPEWFENTAEHAIRWNLGDLAAGTYVIRMVTGSGPEKAVKLSVLR